MELCELFGDKPKEKPETLKLRLSMEHSPANNPISMSPKDYAK